MLDSALLKASTQFWFQDHRFDAAIDGEHPGCRPGPTFSTQVAEEFLPYPRTPSVLGISSVERGKNIEAKRKACRATPESQSSVHAQSDLAGLQAYPQRHSCLPGAPGLDYHGGKGSEHQSEP